MNVTVSHIRSALQECYPPREAANLSRIVCCEMFGHAFFCFVYCAWNYFCCMERRSY